ncbi:hypothetical protein LguiA_004183 [Lonicera macranthoides]
MMLGKRPRPPMKRTISMTEITFDLLNNPQPSEPNNVVDRRSTTAPVSPGNRRRNLVDVVGSGHFLRCCSLCKRRLVPGHDIYMYRGDSAFCSLECRQQQIIQDEKKEKCSLASKKEVNHSTSDASSNGETATVAAV